MIIHVVQPGETIISIAEFYEVPVARLINDNGLTNASNLITGQTIVIVYPKEVYVVKDGDTLINIANENNVTVMQLLRNNPNLSMNRELVPGETIVISYNNSQRTITTSGYSNTFINENLLRKTLPYLTYISIFNYNVSKTGEIKIYQDETNIIKISKIYNVAPLLLVTAMTPQGSVDLEAIYNILLSDSRQNTLIDNILLILETKEYYGVNLSFQYINEVNQTLYISFLNKIVNRLSVKGFYTFLTINPQINNYESVQNFEHIDYTDFSQKSDDITFMNFLWGTNTSPPAPVTSIANLKLFAEYTKSMIIPEKTNLGTPIIGYDWELPYREGYSRANSLTIEAVLNLAQDVGAIIEFDIVSQSPFFYYTVKIGEIEVNHIVWFIDARTIDGLLTIMDDYKFNGAGIWNIMVYFPQLWLILNSQYKIEKILMDET